MSEHAVRYVEVVEVFPHPKTDELVILKLQCGHQYMLNAKFAKPYRMPCKRCDEQRAGLVRVNA